MARRAFLLMRAVLIKFFFLLPRKNVGPSRYTIPALGSPFLLNRRARANCFPLNPTRLSSFPARFSGSELCARCALFAPLSHRVYLIILAFVCVCASVWDALLRYDWDFII